MNPVAAAAAQELRERARVIIADAQRRGIKPTKKYLAAQLGVATSTAGRYLMDVR